MSTDRFTASQDPRERAFCAQLRVQLESEANALDAVTAARLSGARQRALAAAGQRSDLRWLPWFGSAVAASLLLAVVLGRGSVDSNRPATSPRTAASAAHAGALSPPAAVIASDVAVIADLEFYDWLEEQDAVL